VTGLLLAPAACFLPFMSAGKLGAERVSALFTGVEALWGNGMRALGALVLFAGGVLPVALLAILGLLLASAKFPSIIPLRGGLIRAARALEEAAIPEVQVLAILVALTRLGGLVHVRMLAGFWCYCAMSLCLLLAEHGFDFGEISPADAAEGSPVAS
jgi:paraquat-inducible protein A